MSRLTDNDKTFGPLTVGWCGKGMNLKSIAIANFGDDDDYYGTCLPIYAGRLAIRLRLPHFLKPYREWREAGWDAETVKRLGRTGYWQYAPREYGVCVSDGHVSIRYGRQTMDSSTEQTTGFFLPWTQWRMVRHSLYDADGDLFWQQLGVRRGFGDLFEKVDACPKRVFRFRDYDGEEITATTHIEERQWKRGEKWCKWLSLVWPDKVARSLAISFSAEVGPEKGSWKGGTVGHSIYMLVGETHAAAFKRYCSNGYRARGGKIHQLNYLCEKETGQ